MNLPIHDDEFRYDIDEWQLQDEDYEKDLEYELEPLSPFLLPGTPVRARSLTISQPGDAVLIMDPGGGPYSTITRRAWKALSYTTHNTLLSGHQDKADPQMLPIVNPITKATIEGRTDPVLLLMN